VASIKIQKRQHYVILIYFNHYLLTVILASSKISFTSPLFKPFTIIMGDDEDVEDE